MSPRALVLAMLVGACAPPACSDVEDRAIGRDVDVLVADDGPLADAAAERLARRGRASIAVLETGLYDAPAPARLRIVRTLRRTGAPEALPILAHLAAHDPDDDVRQAASAAKPSP